MTTIRRSLAFSFINKYLTQAIMIGTTAIMARLLTPAETGLYMIAYSVIVFVEAARDFDVSTYIIQKTHLDQQSLQTAFTVTMMLSTIPAGLLYLAAEPLGQFYGDPEVARIIRISTIAILVAPFGTLLLGLMRCELAFSKLAWINIWGFVLSNVMATVLASMAGRPKLSMFRPSLARWHEVATFGGTVTLIALLNMAYNLMPRLLMGRLWGLDAVGIYTRAVTICQLPDRTILSALQPVVLSAMANCARVGRDLKAAYLRSHTLTSAVQWPALALLALLAVPAVRILLGSQWLAVAPLVQVMAVATMMLAPAFMTYPLLVSAGRVGDALTSSLITVPVTGAILNTATFLGPQVLVTSLVLTAPASMGVALLFIARATGLRWRELGNASRGSAIATIATATIPAFVIGLSPTGFDLALWPTVLALAGKSVRHGPSFRR